jgi:release factor glutamine methyltransferase
MTLHQTLHQTLQTATKHLKSVTDRPRLEAEILLASFLKVDRSYLLLHADEVQEDTAGFKAWIARRANHEPVEYITGQVSFYDIELHIAPGALIPRPETEILVERAAEVIRLRGLTHIAEIGVGSGAVSIVLARMFPSLKIVASDISEDALAVARRNVEDFGLRDRITLRHTSLLDGIEEAVQMIVSNPPYVALDAELAPNVIGFEPHTALFAEEQGDALLRQIISLAAHRGIVHVACEMGYDQRERISAFVKELGVYSAEFYTDLAGLDRGFVLRSV